MTEDLERIVAADNMTRKQVTGKSSSTSGTTHDQDQDFASYAVHQSGHSTAQQTFPSDIAPPMHDDSTEGEPWRAVGSRQASQD